MTTDPYDALLATIGVVREGTRYYVAITYKDLPGGVDDEVLDTDGEWIDVEEVELYRDNKFRRPIPRPTERILEAMLDIVNDVWYSPVEPERSTTNKDTATHWLDAIDKQAAARRTDTSGRDVTALPGLWDESDTLPAAPGEGEGREKQSREMRPALRLARANNDRQSLIDFMDERITLEEIREASAERLVAEEVQAIRKKLTTAEAERDRLRGHLKSLREAMQDHVPSVMGGYISGWVSVIDRTLTGTTPSVGGGESLTP